MPKLWNDTIRTHRQAVRDAILDAVARLVALNGVSAVTMSDVAEGARIGRATLYRYFPDAKAVLLAWHERQVAGHLAQLAVRGQAAGDPYAALASVLEAYAMLPRGHNGTELAAFLHGQDHSRHANDQIRSYLAELIQAAAAAGLIRDDVAADPMAGYCLAALAAADLQAPQAIRQLVALTLGGLRKPIPGKAAGAA